MSKACKKFSVELSAYFDNELEGEELRTMEEHLDHCESCQKGLERLLKLHDALADMAQSPPGQYRSILKDLNAKLNLESDEDGDPPPLPS